MRRALLALVLALAPACEHDTAPVAGLLNVSLTTPNSGADGAILLRIAGPAALTSAASGGGLRLFTQQAPFGTTNSFVLTGTVAAGTILTIGVPDLSQASAYVPTILQVATPAYQLRTLTGYSLRVAQ